MLKRRQVLSASAGVLGMVAMSPVAASAATSWEDEYYRQAEVQLDTILARLMSLPDDLKTADPSEPSCQKRLIEELDGVYTMEP